MKKLIVFFAVASFGAINLVAAPANESAQCEKIRSDIKSYEDKIHQLNDEINEMSPSNPGYYKRYYVKKSKERRQYQAKLKKAKNELKETDCQK